MEQRAALVVAKKKSSRSSAYGGPYPPSFFHTLCRAERLAGQLGARSSTHAAPFGHAWFSGARDNLHCVV